MMSPFSKRLAKTTRHAQNEVEKRSSLIHEKDVKKSRIQENTLVSYLKENNAPLSQKVADQGILKNSKEVKYVKRVGRGKKETFSEKLASKKALDYGRRLRGERSLFPEAATVKMTPAENHSFYDKAHNPFLNDSSATRSRQSILSGIEVSDARFEALEKRITRSSVYSQDEINASNAAKKLADSKRVLITDTVIASKKKPKFCVEESPVQKDAH